MLHCVAVECMGQPQPGLILEKNRNMSFVDMNPSTLVGNPELVSNSKSELLSTGKKNQL